MRGSLTAESFTTFFYYLVTREKKIRPLPALRIFDGIPRPYCHDLVAPHANTWRILSRLLEKNERAHATRDVPPALVLLVSPLDLIDYPRPCTCAGLSLSLSN